ncbi:olfactory receptor 6M1 [Alligator mississippiensis]|uniref:olfactory receptor 6M1-like n=1 Tax=Alligator mississippiensis TaxID=8496 RepID=UPI0028773B40|nr:olfactory receptor 6M1-like [Alligator mississippiensis]XP_059587346.1 olfactory receptor 6M1 [Alligator mississippiensis]
MLIVNRSSMVTEFVLLGFSVVWELEVVFFMLLLIIYILTITGNVVIISITWVDHRLHSPMYFFLCNLSFLDIMVATAIAPKMMWDFLSWKKTISVSGCIAQCYFYFFFGTTEFILLAVMSLDRYVAICLPLRYSTIMSLRMSLWLALVSWVGGFFSVLSPIIIISQLPFCGPNVIDHFFCDLEPLIKLSCADTYLLELIEFSLSTVVLLSSLLLTVVSYIYIITTILHIPSTTGRKKAFSTCASHITVASVFYGSAIFMYIVPNKQFSFGFKKAVTLQTAVLTHLLNPFIYTLRNQQVKEVLRDTASHFRSSVRGVR